MKHPARRPHAKPATATAPVNPAIAERARQFRQAPSPEEIARRTEAVNALLALRDALPPLDISVTELLRQVRAEEDARLDG